LHTILQQVLSEADLNDIRTTTSRGDFVDGRLTSAHAGKKNLQLALTSDVGTEAGTLVVERLMSHSEFQRTVLPAALHLPLFSRYQEGMEYPDHIDVALMGGMRTDVAVTVFLTGPEAYGGGELVIDTGSGTRSYRLPAGDAIAYPASTVHRIQPVLWGMRFVAVLWVQSVVRDVVQRGILADLGFSAEVLANTTYGPRLNRSYHNLLRRWAETVPGSAHVPGGLASDGAD
jgi:PKHD-type hydroxylase